eukprot:TRINITY_DN9831_c0_g1_i1.p1 TRINITY_DN9831_c0_g1~~TRINITY_DN9831_c0_g1_i1.p1  ORF type:complete len:176 (+),score=42.30 TRINITY_DN9831_c0_g1_i1:107-634(+)
MSKAAKQAEKEAQDKRDEKLLKQYAPKHRPNREQIYTYVGAAFLLNLVPVYLFSSIFGVEIRENFLLFLVTAALNALIIAVGYHNIAYAVRSRLNARREALAPGSSGNEKKNSNRSRATNNETLAFSILYNNALFLASTVFLAFFVFKNSAAPYNYVVSTTASATALSLFASLAL